MNANQRETITKLQEINADLLAACKLVLERWDDAEKSGSEPMLDDIAGWINELRLPVTKAEGQS